jgi:hypothetical protein
VRAPISTSRPSESSRITTRAASHARRWDVSYETPAVFKDGLARLIGVRQDLGIDVDHHLVALAGSAGIDTVIQRGLSEQREGVGLLLRHRRRFRGTVLHSGYGSLGGASPLVERLPRSVQCSEEKRPGLRRQPAPHDHRAVVVLVNMQRAGGVLARSLAHFGLPIDTAPAPNDALDVLGGAGAGHGKQTLLGFGRGDTRDRTHVGIRDFAARECRRQPWQRAERPRDADTFARRTEIEPDAPAEPRRA